MRTYLFSTMLIVFFACSVIAQTPIAHWPLDDDANDIIGSKHGTLEGGASFITDGERDECLLLDGVDGVVNLPSVIWESETDTNTTITCWFNWFGGGDWQRVYSLGMTDGAWQCMYFCPQDNASSLHVTFKTTEPVDQWYDFTSANFTDFDSVTINTWYFSAVILKENTLKIWIDDNIILEEDNVPVTPQRIQPDISQNVLGKSHWEDPTYNGMIDDFRIYGEALTDEQVLAIFNEASIGIKENNTSLALDFYGKDGRILYTSIDESKVSNVSVYSLTGSLMFRSNRISDLKTHQFDPGIYLVSVKSGKESITKKVALIK